MNEHNTLHGKTIEKRYDVWILVFGLNYAFWHITVSFLEYEIQNKLTVAELFDLITPFIMTFIVLRLFLISYGFILKNKWLNSLKKLEMPRLKIFI